MEYIVQIFTGGWHNRNYTAEEIKARLETVASFLPVRKVILGWNLNTDLYKELIPYLSGKGIDALLWLPVFSETGELEPASDALDLFEKPIGNLALQEGENFAFYCPSDDANIENVIRIYEKHFRDCGFDGVFLDKIRTQSFVAGTEGVLSCGCPRCRKIYAERGLDLSQLQKAYTEQKDHLFDAACYTPGTGFRFENELTEQFFDIKAEIIAGQVQKLCRYFKDRNMQVGLDLYAPLMSRFVGQDYSVISKEADFIKPMMYRKTEAPAGIGYEYRLLKENIPEASGYPDIVTDQAFLHSQLKELEGLSCDLYPGLEINYREDIARTDPAYITESLQTFRDCGMNGAVLSWDIMLAPDSHLKAVKE